MLHRSRFPSQFVLLTEKPRPIITDQWRGQCLKVSIFGFLGIEASPIFNMCLTTDFILPLGANLFPFLILLLHRGAAPNFSHSLHILMKLANHQTFGDGLSGEIFPPPRSLSRRDKTVRSRDNQQRRKKTLLILCARI